MMARRRWCVGVALAVVVVGGAAAQAEPAAPHVLLREFDAAPSHGRVADSIESQIEQLLGHGSPGITVKRLSRLIPIRDPAKLGRQTDNDFLIGGRVTGGMLNQLHVEIELTFLDEPVHTVRLPAPPLPSDSPALVQRWVQVQVDQLRAMVLGESETAMPSVYLSCFRPGLGLEDGAWLRSKMPALAGTRLKDREPGQSYLIHAVDRLEDGNDPCGHEAAMRRWFDFMVSGDLLPKRDTRLVVELEISDARNNHRTTSFESSWRTREDFLREFTDSLCDEWEELFVHGDLR